MHDERFRLTRVISRACSAYEGRVLFHVLCVDASSFIVIHLSILLVLVRSFLLSNYFEQNIIQLTCNFQSLSLGREGRGGEGRGGGGGTWDWK